MRTHDPRQIAEDLRNHLATHDRRLLFLFGAGTSCAVNVAAEPDAGVRKPFVPLIPGIAGLTEVCAGAVAELGADEAKAWELLARGSGVAGGAKNVEAILSSVRMKIDAIGVDETLVGLDRDALMSVEARICRSIARVVNPPEDAIPSRVPHDAFASWVRRAVRTVPLEIFTTNYDVLIERALEASRLPVFDGFVGAHRPFFFSDCLDDESQLPGPHSVRLWKLHGSVNWRLEDGSGGKRIVRGAPSETGELILPSNRKYDESRKQPYVAFMDRLSRRLNDDHALLITCGYNFGDDHVDAIIYSALDSRPSTNVIALHYGDLQADSPLAVTAIGSPNLTVIGPNAGVVSGEWGEWRLAVPVDERTASFMDHAFDSNAMPEEAPSDGESLDLRGRMRLGDFKWFCRFLEAMGSDR